MKKQYDTGLHGENAAEQYLVQQGMTTVTRRYRGEDGEIDLIMRDGDALVFVEVKSRPHSVAGSGVLAVTASKQKRMLHAATAFLVEHDWLDRPVRFDVVEISRSGILHIPNAFSAS